MKSIYRFIAFVSESWAQKLLLERKVNKEIALTNKPALERYEEIKRIIFEQGEER